MVVKGPLSSFSSSSLSSSSSSSSSSSFEWERDAKGFYDRHFIVLFVAALMYYPVILGIKYLMRNRKAFDLGGAKSRAMVNWIFWWEASLAAFSFVAATQVVPLALEPLYEQGLSWSESICKLRTHDDPRAFWMFLFNLSKVFEFGDTVLVVLRKKKLIMLQHYHHLATMIYCWYATVITYRLNNTNPYFAGMNLVVHSIMYTWYAATRTGWKSPRVVMIFITLIQLIQMVGGIIFVFISIFGEHESCGMWLKREPYGLIACVFMYASFLVLFTELFVNNYILKKKKTLKDKTA